MNPEHVVVTKKTIEALRWYRNLVWAQRILFVTRSLPVFYNRIPDGEIKTR